MNTSKKTKCTLSLGRRVASGGFGSFYKATDENGKVYGIKFIGRKAKGFLGSGDSGALLEFDVMAKTTHPFINRSLEITSDERGIYIVQHFADGGNLAKWRETNWPSEEEIKKWTLMSLFALKELHDDNIVHGDVKGNNILLFKPSRPDSYVKLTDNGLSVKLRWGDYVNTNFVTTCTSTHRPPEVWLQREVTKAIDVWAMGVTLYEIAYDKYLFPYDPASSEDPAYSLGQIIKWSREVGKSLPEWLEKYPVKMTAPLAEWTMKGSRSSIDALILRMCEPDPLKRPSVEELIADPWFNNIREGIRALSENRSPRDPPRPISDARKNVLAESFMSKGIDSNVAKLTATLQIRAINAAIRPRILSELCLLVSANLLNYRIPPSYTFEHKMSELVEKELVLFEALGYRFL